MYDCKSGKSCVENCQYDHTGAPMYETCVIGSAACEVCPIADTDACYLYSGEPDKCLWARVHPGNCPHFDQTDYDNPLWLKDDPRNPYDHCGEFHGVGGGSK